MATLARRVGLRWGTLAVACLGVIVGLSCSKSAPEGPAAGGPAPGGAAAQTPGAEPAAQPTAQPTAQPAPAPTPAPAAAAPAAPPEPEGPPGAGLAAVADVPADVFAFGGVRSLEAGFRLAADVVSPVHPFPGLPDVVLGALQSQVGLSGMGWIERSAPVWFVTLNPRKFNRNGVVVLRAASVEGFKASLPTTRRTGEEGADYVYEQAGKATYVLVRGSDVLFAQDSAALPEAAAFLEKSLRAAEFSAPAEVVVAVKNVVAAYGPQLDAAQAEATKAASRYALLAVPGVAKFVEAQYAALFDFVRELERVVLSARAREGRALLGLDFDFREGSGMNAWVRAMKGRSGSLSALLDPAAYLVAAGNIDPAVGKKWTALGVGWLRDVLKLTAAEATELQGYADESGSLDTGEFAVSVAGQPGFAFGFESIAGTRDGARSRALFQNTWALVLRKAGAQLRAYSGAAKGSPGALDLTSFTTLIASVAAVSRQMGVELAVGDETDGGVVYEWLDVRLDYTKMAFLEGRPEAAAAARALLGGQFKFVMAFAPARVVFCVGPEAVRRAKEIVAGKAGLGSDPAFQRSVDGSKAGSAFLLYASPYQALRALSALPKLQAAQAAIGGLAGAPGPTVTARAEAEAQLKVLVDLPVAPLGQILKAGAALR